jgi:hypothetical protein
MPLWNWLLPPLLAVGVAASNTSYCLKEVAVTLQPMQTVAGINDWAVVAKEMSERADADGVHYTQARLLDKLRTDLVAWVEETAANAQRLKRDAEAQVAALPWLFTQVFAHYIPGLPRNASSTERTRRDADPQGLGGLLRAAGTWMRSLSTAVRSFASATIQLAPRSFHYVQGRLHTTISALRTPRTAIDVAQAGSTVAAIAVEASRNPAAQKAASMVWKELPRIMRSVSGKLFAKKAIATMGVAAVGGAVAGVVLRDELLAELPEEIQDALARNASALLRDLAGGQDTADWDLDDAVEAGHALWKQAKELIRLEDYAVEGFVPGNALSFMTWEFFRAAAGAKEESDWQAALVGADATYDGRRGLVILYPENWCGRRKTRSRRAPGIFKMPSIRDAIVDAFIPRPTPTPSPPPTEPQPPTDPALIWLQDNVVILSTSGLALLLIGFCSCGFCCWCGRRRTDYALTPSAPVPTASFSQAMASLKRNP